jgi:universal stress protein E
MKRFKNVLCVVETDGNFKAALERAVTLAENNQANLTVVSVMDPVTAGISLPSGDAISGEAESEMLSARLKQLESLIELYRQRISIQASVLTGTPFLEIIRTVLRNDFDLVIKTPENPDWLTQLFGSDDMHLLRECPCPIWLVKAEGPKPYRRILAAVDVDEDYPPVELETERALNVQVLEMASSLALSDFAELHVVHVWSAPGESAMRGGFLNRPEEQVKAYVEQVGFKRGQALDAILQQVGGKLGADALDYIKPQPHLIKGWARKEIPALAKRLDADLIVMGTVARTGVPGFVIGNTAETILNQIGCSVLAIKPPGFITPVTVEE